MAVLKICLAYVAACIVVGFIWMVVAMFASSGPDVSEVLFTWGLISLLVGGFGLFPFVILRSVMWLINKETLLMTVTFAAAMGALLFGLVFGTWADSGNPTDLLSLLASGAGLGCVGGAVYWRIETWLWRFWPEQSAETA